MIGDPLLASRLRKVMRGEVLFDPFTRGRYSTDASIYQIELNRQLKGSGWHFPVDVSTSANATIGGMTGNNSAGTRSIKYGIMVHNVLEGEAVLADGTRLVFGDVPEDLASSPRRLAELGQAMRALSANNAQEIAERIAQ